MLEKLLYKIVDFGRRHPKLKYIMLIPLAVVYLLDTILYYLSLPFLLIGQAVFDRNRSELPASEESIEEAEHKPHRLKKAILVLVLFALCMTYPVMRYFQGLNQPIQITSFDEIKDAELVIESGTSIDALGLPEQISARGYKLDKEGNPIGNEKQVILKITSWNAEPGYDENAEAGEIYTFTPILDDQYLLSAKLPSITRTVADEQEAMPIIHEVFLNGQGNDENDGLTPMQAVKTFDRAVQLLGGKDGTVWIMNGITIKDEQIWNTEQRITLKRFAGSSTMPAYTGALIDIRSTGSLHIDNLIIDGSEEVVSHAAAIMNDGTLEVTKNTQIINNQYPDHAGAIDVGSTGKLIMSVETNFTGCSTDVKGSAVSAVRGSSLINHTEQENDFYKIICKNPYH